MTAYPVQADALEIEACAERRLADEYDAAQERGEVAFSGDTLRAGPGVPNRNAGKATAAARNDKGEGATSRQRLGLPTAWGRTRTICARAWKSLEIT